MPLFWLDERELRMRCSEYADIGLESLPRSSSADRDDSTELGCKSLSLCVAFELERPRLRAAPASASTAADAGLRPLGVVCVEMATGIGGVADACGDVTCCDCC